MNNLGLLLIRIGVGLVVVYHGYPKLMGGEAVWADLGSIMSTLGITFFPVAWGFAFAAIQFIGGLLFLFGVFFRGATFFLFLNMLIVTLVTFLQNGLPSTAYPFMLTMIFLGMLLLNEGRYAVSRFIR